MYQDQGQGETSGNPAVTEARPDFSLVALSSLKKAAQILLPRQYFQLHCPAVICKGSTEVLVPARADLCMTLYYHTLP